MPIRPLSRRAFCKSSALALPYFVPRHILGGNGFTAANDRIEIGVIGCGVRGKFLIANLPTAGRVVSLCDCSLDNVENTRHPTGRFAKPLKLFSESDATSCSVYQDYRSMIAEQRLDAVIVAAPDHHHALATVLACRAGLDVYCEKPLSLTIAEGRAMVDAARQHNRVVQVGSQQRTMTVNRVGCEFVRDGGLGRVSRVQVRNFPSPLRYDENFEEQEPPSSLSWDLFCGPTPLRKYSQRLWVKDAFQVGFLLWRGWDLFRSYSGHLMTNWGAHSLDMVQYALGTDNTGPSEIWLEKDRLAEWRSRIDDQWHDKTPPLGAVSNRAEDRMRFCPLTMRYPSGTLLEFDPNMEETIFHGERGRLFMRRNRYWTEPAGLAPEIDPAEQRRWSGDGHVARPHLANWLQAVRERSEPNAPIEVGHRSATICHLGNLARQLGRRLKWDARRERFQDDDEANSLLERPRRAGFELS